MTALNLGNDDSQDQPSSLQEANNNNNDRNPQAAVFELNDPRAIAHALKTSADTSTRRKAPPFRSAMSMLVFYLNRAGDTLPQERIDILEQAKDELRDLYGKPRKLA